MTIPDTPQHLRTILTDDGIRLRWSSVRGAVGYRVYRDGFLIAQVLEQASSYLDTTTQGRHAYTVSAYSHEGESAQSGSAAS